jgi:hypothetical protein
MQYQDIKGHSATKTLQEGACQGMMPLGPRQVISLYLCPSTNTVKSIRREEKAPCLTSTVAEVNGDSFTSSD